MFSEMSTEITSNNCLKLNAIQFLRDYVNGRHPNVEFTQQMLVSQVFDSLGYLDFFLHIENHFGETISLDDLASCRTFDELAVLMQKANEQAGQSKVNMTHEVE